MNAYQLQGLAALLTETIYKHLKEETDMVLSRAIYLAATAANAAAASVAQELGRGR